MDVTVPKLITLKFPDDLKALWPVKIQTKPDLPFVNAYPAWGSLAEGHLPSYCFTTSGVD
jgi:hypothetical protein